MVNFSIIADDRLVIVNGLGINFNFKIDKNIHAVHNQNGICTIEYKHKNNEKGNPEHFNYIIQEYLKIQNDIKVREVAELKTLETSYIFKRQKAYHEQGLTIEALTVALVEANAGNLADLAIIQEKRAKIKNDIPKD